MTRILILSDLHAYRPSPESKREPSFLIASSKDNPANPIRAIPDILKQEGLSVDWILCPGDIADQADPDAQTFAWEELVELKKAVKAKLLLSTAGNHDVDSRLKFTNFDPKGHLQSLIPPFPGLKPASDKYWARNYHIYEQDSIRLVNLNSAAFHGFHSDEQGPLSEYRHGRVSNRTIDAIVEEIKQQQFQTNILFTHHHPYENQSIFDDDYSEMQLGGKLIAALTDATASSWLVIHGHQHYPQVSYGPTDAFPPLIFSAGSISAKITSPLSAEAPNQFYLMTIESDPCKTNGWWPCVTIRAWSWIHRREWQVTPDGQNIPDGLGFGCRDNVASIANTIRAYVCTQSSHVTLQQIFDVHPYLQFASRKILDEAIKTLKQQNIRCTVTVPFAESQFRQDGAGT
jgi:predicted phosphodiesterase